MPKLTKKHYKKRKTKQKKGKRGRRTKRIYKKMKGGVSFNPVFSTSLLPKNTYYELNNYNDDPSRPPEVVDARLLPTLKGGKKKNTRKRRGGNNTQKLKFIKETIKEGNIKYLERALQNNPELASQNLLKYAQTNSDEDLKDEIIGMIEDTILENKKMKGGSLIGTDLVTGINTTDTNAILAFGTTGGTEYMYNTLAGNSINSGPYMSSRTDVNPNLA